MTIAKQDRKENQKLALSLMLRELEDRALDETLFRTTEALFTDVLPTTWEELAHQECVQKVAPSLYRLTAKGWLVALELSGIAQSATYLQRVGRLLAAMKQHVTPRADSAIVSLKDLSKESGEPEGWIFNVIDSKAGATGAGRTGARWFGGERGRLVEIPVDFNLEPSDITSALTVQHLDRIRQLEERLESLEEDRKQFHCPYCDAPLAGIFDQDYPDYHCVVTYESFECGYVTGDGFEECPCPYGPNWPKIDEFDFVTKQEGDLWICDPIPRTARAKRAHPRRQSGRTEQEAEERAKKAATPKSR